jgi:hypothetical protein
VNNAQKLQIITKGYKFVTVFSVENPNFLCASIQKACLIFAEEGRRRAKNGIFCGLWLQNDLQTQHNVVI